MGLSSILCKFLEIFLAENPSEKIRRIFLVLSKRQIMRLLIKRTPLISDVQVCGIFPGAAPTTEAGHPVQTDQARPFAYIFLLIP